MRKTTILSSFLVMSLFLSGCNSDKKQLQEIKTIVPEQTIPKNEYPLKNLDGKTYNIKKVDTGFTLENAKGKVIILDIYATWCPPCRIATKHLSSLKSKYKDNLVIIGLTVEDPISNEKLKDFKKQYNINYTLVNSNQNQKLIKAIANSLDVGKNFPIPFIVIYKDGKLINNYVGSVEEEFIESDIKRALGR